MAELDRFDRLVLMLCVSFVVLLFGWWMGGTAEEGNAIACHLGFRQSATTAESLAVVVENSGCRVYLDTLRAVSRP